MRIALINPPQKNLGPNKWVPLGLTYIAAILEKNGHNIKIIDMNAKNMSLVDLDNYLNGDFDVIGVTGMITQYSSVLSIIATSKMKCPKAKVILGGPLATTLFAELLENSLADFVVLGEGEKSISSLIESIESGSKIVDIKGIAYRDNGQIIVTKPVEPISNLDTLPFPARHLLDMQCYIQDHFKNLGLKIEGYNHIRSTNLISSRGCPYNCTFCFKDMWGFRWRGRSAKNIVDEMSQLNELYGINGFFFNDDTFVLDRERIFELAAILKERELNFIWYCNGRINLMDEDLLKAMYGAGCRCICYGIESGNQRILDSLNKGIKISDIRKVVAFTKNAGIKITGYFMIGMPGETNETIQDTISLARELDLDFYGFSITTPLPGTRIYLDAVDRGLIKGGIQSLKEWDFDVNINLTKSCTDEDLTNFKYYIFREFTLKKLYGKYFFLNPLFIKQVVLATLSARNIDETKSLFHKGYKILKH